ncbi:3-phenylpropionate MFS transporter [Pelagibius sp. Alg239-R121]|uniref:3-phenylpropionate MFS transporter n=1 Tax=Pelagibius sp. Alg239-R121 TaxID=2993448 RepID=UPI0024A73F0F|nr:3-phenylpropionate MFS transporter [Pelagibius sp. Alg239-R121]
MSSTQLSVRYAAFYAAIFAAIGIYIPFWPLWLGAKGLSAEEIAALLATASWLKIATTPGFAQISDRSGRPKATMIAVALIAVTAFALLSGAAGFWMILAISLIALAAMHALPPLCDSQTLAAVYGQGLDYGRIRLWGSIGFIAAAAAAGPLVESYGIDAFLPLLVVLLLITLGTVVALPGQRHERKERSESPRQNKGSWRPLLQPRFLIFLVCASLLQASHATYYAFSTIHWQAAGHSESVIGLLWAEGVVAEVFLFAVSGKITGRLRPSLLLLIGGACGVVRWLVIGETTWLPALVGVQLLHAGTFGATHLGAMHFIARRAPKGSAATAQSLYAAISGGLGMGLGLLLAGLLYSESPAFAFFAMAGLAGLAILLAFRLLSFPRAAEEADADRTVPQ